MKIEHYIVTLANAYEDLYAYACGGHERDAILTAAKVVEKELHIRFRADNNGEDLPTGEILELVFNKQWGA